MRGNELEKVKIYTKIGSGDANFTRKPEVGGAKTGTSSALVLRVPRHAHARGGGQVVPVMIFCGRS